MRPEPLPYIDTVPQWLGPTLMLLGTGLFVYWGLERYFETGTPTGQLYALLTAVGVTFTTAGALGITETLGMAAMVLFAVGRFVEGGASVRTLRKVSYVATNFESPGGEGGLWQWVKHHLLLMATGTTTVGILYALLFIGGTDPLLFEITLVWTMGTFITAVLGLSWKLGSAEGMSSSLTLGLLLTFSGAAVYDYATLSADFLIIIVGFGAFLCGVLVGAVAVVTK